jgi:cytochrome c553
MNPQLVVAVLCMLGVGVTTSARAEIETVDQLVHNAMRLDKHPDRGGKLFARYCSSCHGVSGGGDAEQVIPSLAGQRQAYLIKQFADFSLRERDSKPMHTVVSQAPVRDPQAWADIAAYLNGSPPVDSPQTGDGKDLELGEAIYGEQCASCHEEDGRGDDEGFVPSLRNQHYSYIVQQVQNLALWHRRDVDANLIRFLGSFDQQERMAVADWLARMRDEPHDRLRLNDDGTAGD